MFTNRIIGLYLIEFSKVFSVLILSFSTFFSVVALLEKIHDYLAYEPSALFYIEFVLLNIPRYFFYLLPFVTLISSLFVFSIAVKNREILIISLSGARLKRFFLPFIVLSLVISLFGFILGEFIQPEFTKELNRLVAELTERGKSLRRNNLYIMAKDGTVVKIGSLTYSETKRGSSSGRDIKVFTFKDNSLDRVIEAQEADISDEIWTLRDVVIYDFSSAKVSREDSYRLTLDVNINLATIRDIRKIEEIRLKELLEKREELKRMGLMNPKIDTDISARLSYNFVTLFMMILGISIPLGAYEKLESLFARTRGTQSAQGALLVGIGILLMILYWVIYSVFIFLGYSKILPPLLSPWITPVIFGALSIKLWLSIRD